MNTIYLRNADGGVVDPPIIRDYERRIFAAMEETDYLEIARLTGEYNQARDQRIKLEEGDDSPGLGWSDDDLRGGLREDQTGMDLRPSAPAGMPVSVTDEQYRQNQVLLAQMREMQEQMRQLIEAGKTDQATDQPTQEPDAPARPLGWTEPPAGAPTAKPNPTVAASEPTGLVAGQGGVPSVDPNQQVGAVRPLDAAERPDDATTPQGEAGPSQGPAGPGPGPGAPQGGDQS